MMAPQVVGVLLKKPGQPADSQNHPRIPPLDPQETKIRGELYVEDLGERRMITIRMGWLWVEGTEMKLPLRALNLRQAAPSLCQPHATALGFTLSNSQNNILATFWADTEPIWWSWVRAIAAELVRQTPFRAQRRLNFLEILTICPRGPVPLPDSPTETRRRSRSELRPWFRNSTNEKQRANGLSLTPEESRRRARSELRGWSSNSSDEDVLGEFRSIPNIIPRTEVVIPRPWAFSESSEGSDDSLPWSGGQSSVDSVDSVTGPAVIIPEPETREQRIQRYKETRRRENEARSRRVVEEDAKRRKARAEENNNSNNKNNNNNNHLSLIKLTKLCYDNVAIRNVRNNNNNNNNSSGNNANKNRTTSSNNNVLETSRSEREKSVEKCRESEISTPCRIASTKVVETCENGKADSVKKKFPIDSSTDRLLAAEEPKNSVNIVNNTSVSRNECSERRSRARERRVVREKVHPSILPQSSSSSSSSSVCNQIDTLQDRKDRLSSLYSRIPIPHESVTPSSILRTISAGTYSNTRISTTAATILNPTSTVKSSKNDRDSFGQLPKSPTTPFHKDEPTEEAVARLLERCQRVDHYVPVRDKLTLFESLSRLGGRLARSTEDLGRAKANPSPRGKQRARSLHDLNRAARSVPVREMCRLFEGEPSPEGNTTRTTSTRNKYSDSTTHPRTRSEGCTPPSTPLLPTRVKTSAATAIKASHRKKAFRDGRH